MAKNKYNQGVINRNQLKFPDKYMGKFNEIVFRSSWEQMYAQWLDVNPKILKWNSRFGRCEILPIAVPFSVIKSNKSASS